MPATRAWWRRSILSLALLSGLVFTPATVGFSQDTSGAAQTPRTIGYVAIDLTDANIASLSKLLDTETQARGWSLAVVDARGSVDQANAGIQALVQRGVDAIIVTVFSSDSLTAGLSAAQAAGIPVLSHGGGLSANLPGAVAAAFEASGGETTTARMINDLGGNGQVLAFTYRPGRPCLLREVGLDSVSANYTTVNVTKQQVAIPGYVESAAQTTTGWLAAHPAGSAPLAIWACWDSPALGAISALKQANRADVKVYGHNADPDALTAVRAGTLTATLFFDIKATAKAELDVLAQVMQAGSDWQPGVFAVPTVMVDRSNLDQFLSDHPEAATGA